MTRDSIENQILENRRIMKGLPPTSPVHKRLSDENMQLGQQLVPAPDQNTPEGGPAWEQIADILAGMEGGADAEYKHLHGVQKAFVAQETDAIWRIIWAMKLS